MSYNENSGRPARKAAQSKIDSAAYAVQGKSAKAAVGEARTLLQGKSGLSTETKVSNLKAARDALKVAASHKKNVDTPVAETLQAAREDLKKALKSYK